MEKHFEFTNFFTPVPGALRGVLYNDTTARDRNSLNWLGMKASKSGVVSMILKTGMEVDKYYTIFNYGPPRPQKDLKSQDRAIVAGPGMNPEPKTVLPGHIQEEFGKEPPPQIHLSWITWKHCWPPQFIRLVETQLFPLWRGS